MTSRVANYRIDMSLIHASNSDADRNTKIIVVTHGPASNMVSHKSSKIRATSTASFSFSISEATFATQLAGCPRGVRQYQFDFHS